VLSHLTCASLTEDRYGVVQRDIPKILEAFLSFLSAVEEYRVEISAQDTLTASNEDISNLSPDVLRDKERVREEVIKATEILNFMEDGEFIFSFLSFLNLTLFPGLKEGIIRIVVTFGDSLSAFKFPPKIARKLQGYVDYS
jgi:nucleoporin NDC1